MGLSISIDCQRRRQQEVPVVDAVVVQCVVEREPKFRALSNWVRSVRVAIIWITIQYVKAEYNRLTPRLKFLKSQDPENPRRPRLQKQWQKLGLKLHKLKVPQQAL